MPDFVKYGHILNFIQIVATATTVWQVIFVGASFCGKSEKALKINFYDFKFRDSNQSRAVALLHK